MISSRYFGDRSAGVSAVFCGSSFAAANHALHVSVLDEDAGLPPDPRC